MKAQTSLVKRSHAVAPLLQQISKNPQNLLARLHAMWALQQIWNQPDQIDSNLEIQHWFTHLLQDPSEEIRANACRIIGLQGASELTSLLLPALVDASDSVRFQAAMAWARLKKPMRLQNILEFITHEANQHPVMRHAGVIALTGTADEEQITELKDHPTPQVRLAAVLALRRLKSPALGHFLGDQNPLIVLEASRAIHDTPIPEAYDALAAMHDSEKQWRSAFISKDNQIHPPDLIHHEHTQPSMFLLPMLHRVYHTNHLLGQKKHLQNLIEGLELDNVPESFLTQCATWINSRLKPPPHSKMQGDWVPSGNGTHTLLASLLSGKVTSWMKENHPARTGVILACIRTYKWQKHQTLVESTLNNFQADPALRSTALRILSEWQVPGLNRFVDAALISNSAQLRTEAVLVQSILDPEDKVAFWVSQLEYDSLDQKKKALNTMATIPDRRVDAVVLYWLEQALQEKVPQPLHEALRACASKRTAPAILNRLQTWNSNVQKQR